jgi:Protein involved in initiation of plasmid replication
MKKDNHSNKLIVKSNQLIEASYRLTAGEQKIILSLVSMIRADDDEFKKYKIKIAEFEKLLGIKNNRIYKDVKEITNELMKKVFTIKTSNSTLQLSWLSSVEYLDGIGEVELEFSPKLKPYLLQLKNRFTSYKLKEIIQLKSFYSLRIYEFLKQYEKIGERTFSIDELRVLFQIKENEYARYNDFKRKVIIQAKNEINKKTDLTFDYKELKTGRKVTSLRFLIQSKTSLPDVVVIDSISNSDEDKSDIVDKFKLIKEIIEENITELEASSILDAAKGNINIIKEKYAIAKVTNSINNIVSWMIDAIKNDYQHPKGKKQEGTFNNFKQRQYDGKDLKRKLLGWDKYEDKAADEVAME